MSTSWKDWISIALVICGVAIGLIPIIGSPLRLVFGILAVGSGIGVLASKTAQKKALVVIGIVAGAAIMAWSLISLAIVSGLIGAVISSF